MVLDILASKGKYAENSPEDITLFIYNTVFQLRVTADISRLLVLLHDIKKNKLNKGEHMKILLLIFMAVSLVFGLDCSYIENTSNRDNEQLCRRTVTYETLSLGDKYEKEFKVKILDAEPSLKRKLLGVFFADMEMCYNTCMDKLNKTKK